MSQSSKHQVTFDEAQQVNPHNLISLLREAAASGKLPTIEPLLPMLLNLRGQPFSLQDHFHFAPLFRLRRPQRTTLMCARQVGKCLVRSATPTIWLSDGRVVGTDAIRVGMTVAALDEHLQATTGTVSRIFETPRQSAWRVRTRMGAELELTADHKIRTLSGFKRVADLRVNDRICALQRAGVFAAKPLDIDPRRLRFIPLLVGDGCCGLSQNFSLTNALPAVVEFAQAHEAVTGPVKVRWRRRTAQISFSKKPTRLLRQWVEADGLWGKYAWEKSLPDWVFQLDRAQTATLLGHLFATDGHLKAPQTIVYYSTSRTLVRQVRSLLTKFGIPTTTSRKRAGYRKPDGMRVPCRPCYCVRVWTARGVAAFLREIVVPGKPAFTPAPRACNNNRDTCPRAEAQTLIDALSAYVRFRRGSSFRQAGLRQRLEYAPQREKLARYYDLFAQHVPADDARLQRLRDALSADVAWDTIISIEAIGLQPTIDFEIQSAHNFVVDSICTHNSTFIGADTVTLSSMIPHFTTLCVTPLYEQIRRFSTLVVRPFVLESPLRALMLGSNTENSVLQRTFLNGSRMMFSFASVDADRIRGLSVNRCAVDEIQDVDKDLLPIILETMSADRKYALELYAGTPKTTDGTAAYVWNQSSQAEWWIPCQHCTTNGHRTWNIPATEYHLFQMIGPLRHDISADRPAIICYKCAQPLYPRLGHWEHRYKERRWEYAGYHVSQPIVPLHYDNARKWAALLHKQQTRANSTFINECLAEPCDEGQKLLSLTELRAACTLPWVNTPRAPDLVMMRRLGQYRSRVLAVDWGGGGESGLSTTVLALVCMNHDGTIEVPWAKQMLGVDHIAEAREVAHWFSYFDCTMLTHDYSGAGTLRETILIQAGIPMRRDMPIQYVGSGQQDLLVPIRPTDTRRRTFWRMDKTRALHLVIASIRLGQVRFFQYDNLDLDSPALIDHFLRLVEHRSELEVGGSYYSIRSNMLGPDDFAQAVALGCVCSWEINQAYPPMARAAEMELTDEMLARIGGIDYGWETDPHPHEFL